MTYLPRYLKLARQGGGEEGEKDNEEPRFLTRTLIAVETDDL